MSDWGNSVKYENGDGFRGTPADEAKAPFGTSVGSNTLYMR